MLRVKSYKKIFGIIGVLILMCWSPLLADYIDTDVQDEEERGQYFNKLIYEKSPYLLGHADNPVDWYPWGEEAFEKARREDKPIFLSIGYSSCHWCHVMEQESFMNFKVAALINQVFVPVLVDREERPDIDKVYGLAAELIAGRRGWPQNVLLTPDLKPFFAASYMPRQNRFGQTGLVETTLVVAEMWESQRERILTSADRVESALKQTERGQEGDDLDSDLLRQTYEKLRESYDERSGGFSDAPKFPLPHKLMYLLQYWNRTGDESALAMVEKTLEAMRRGGIYDHVGFGFHRYSTDAHWQVPHFEKMLYDQAMIAMAYIEGYQATGKDEYAETARQMFTYVLRDLAAPSGGFYTSEDADSAREEGWFYLWSYDELEDALTAREFALVRQVYGIDERGNYVDPMLRQRTSLNILYMEKTVDELAGEFGMTPDELSRRLRSMRRKLFELRETRERPDLDDKILTDWNGLMIASLAKGARVFDDGQYRRRAERSANFILREMITDEGRLMHRFRDGEVAVQAHLDDYAFLIWGLLELYETTFKVKYLESALELTDSMVEFFGDTEGGGFYFTASDGEKLLIRQKQVSDGAYPSGNAVAMHNLLKLGRITANTEYEELAAGIGRSSSGSIRDRQAQFTHLMSALDFATGPSYELVVAGHSGSRDTRDMVRAIHRQYLPNKVLVLRPTEVDSPEIIQYAEYTRYQDDVDGRAVAYVCKNYTCKTPTSDIDTMLRWLSEP